MSDFKRGLGWPSLLAVALSLGLGLGLAGGAAAQDAQPQQQPPPTAAQADKPEKTVTPERWALHLQATDILQYYPAFHSAFQGPNSFSPRATTGNTFDATLYAGVKLWAGGELWGNLEMYQGFAPNNTLGAAGYVNGDGAKVGRAHPYARLARVFVRQTFDLGGEADDQQADLNVLGAHRTKDRVVITAGKLNVTDVFDTNKYAHDPRQDFLNWSLITAGSFDYAADAWGYTYGAAAEWYRGDWAWRGGVFDLSIVPNSAILTSDFSQFQLIGEAERRFTLGGRPGAVRLAGFVTRGGMGRYDDAVRLAQATGRPADTALVRHYRSRPGAYAMCVISEGATLTGDAAAAGERQLSATRRSEQAVSRRLALLIEEQTGQGTIVQQLAYLMRSGDPDALDRMVGFAFGGLAVRKIEARETGCMLALRDGNYASVPIDTLLGGTKIVDVAALYDAARYRPKLTHVEGMPMFLY